MTGLVRYYCWRTGAILLDADFGADGECVECGWSREEHLDAAVKRGITRTVPARIAYPVDADGRAVES